MISKIIAVNKRAKFDYELLETLEAGIVLKGSEVKSCRLYSVSIKEAHIAEMQGEFYLLNANIPEYKPAALSHEPKASRKLLMRKKQVSKWLGKVKEKGLTIVPIQVYLSEKGIIKIEIALARGKNVRDKRETIKEREWARTKSRVLKG